LGHYRKSFVSPSNGKRAKKRKRKHADADAAAVDVPPPPELANYVDLGLSSISKSLEKMAAASARGAAAGSGSAGSGKPTDTPTPEPYAVIFVARSGQPSAFHSHFPQMVAVASKSVSDRQPIRLIGFSAACEERLSSSLGIPRVSCIGLREGAPQMKGLVEYVREHVAPVDMAWFQETQSGRYLETKIDAIEVSVGTKKQKT
jgi:ribonuclease P/MRP protein subunit POP3